jgi:hypothetical protein
LKDQQFPHPRHDFGSSVSIACISLDQLNLDYQIQGQKFLDTFLHNKNIVVISCFDDFYTYNYLFGDYIDFHGKNQGLYSAPEFQPAFDAIQEICQRQKYCFLITPQPQTQETFLDNERLFYIEVPEFYGIYRRWFSQGYEIENPDVNLQRHFLLLNKRNRPGRQLLFYLAYGSNLLDKSYASFLGHASGLKTKFSSELFDNNDALIQQTNTGLEQVGNEIRKILPYSSDALLEIRDQTMGTGGWLPDHRLYEQSFISIIGETHESVNGATIFTEKIFRTIWFRRPFLVLGGAGYLRELRKLGFQTFGRWINESYDLEPSLFLRVQMIHKEMIKISTLSIRDCKNILIEMQSVLDHNLEILKHLDDLLPARLREIDRFILSKDVHLKNQKPCLRR